MSGQPMHISGEVSNMKTMNSSFEKRKEERTQDVIEEKEEKTPDTPLSVLKNPPPKKRPVREKMNPDDIIRSEKIRWKVISLLGSGGFGDVYKVVNVNDKDRKEYAMKTEMNFGTKATLLRLKVEVMVLSECNAIPNPKHRKHFVEMADRGKSATFKFLVMGLVGPSLEDIRKKYLQARSFSKSTALLASLQCLEALADLHSLGWLHRDIKPANFAIGLADLASTIFMLDFGIAHKIFNKNTRVLKTPRAKVKFLGTTRFASRACHNGIEQGRKDDLESWLYMLYDLLDGQCGLPWKFEKNKVLLQKNLFFKQKIPVTSHIIPKDLKRVAKYIDELSYRDDPDYKFIVITIISIAKDSGIPMNKELDWIVEKTAGKDLTSMKTCENKAEEVSDEARQSGGSQGSNNDEVESKTPNEASKNKKSNKMAGDIKSDPRKQ